MRARKISLGLLTGALLTLISPASLGASGVCRIKIGEEWIPMGAAQLSSCLKYAESAASPGERQYASFDEMSFYFLNGQFLRSVDNGQTWQNFRLSNSEGAINSLNVLRSSGASEDSAVVKRPAEPVTKPDTTDTMAGKAEAIAEEALPSSESVYTVPSNSPRTRTAVTAKPFIAESPVAATSTVGTPVEPVQRPAKIQRPRAQNTTTAISPSPPPVRDCQINTGSGWQNVFMPSLSACGDLLAQRMKRFPDRRGHAYWGNQYLLYFGGVLYQSSDGRDWRKINP